jgi:hypothetical protein
MKAWYGKRETNISDLGTHNPMVNLLRLHRGGFWQSEIWFWRLRCGWMIVRMEGQDPEMAAMQQDEQTGRKTANTMNKSARPLAAFISILWVFFFVVLTYFMWAMWAGGDPDYIWFALVQITAIIATIIQFKWVRAGGFIFMAEGAVLLPLCGLGIIPLLVGILYLASESFHA